MQGCTCKNKEVIMAFRLAQWLSVRLPRSALRGRIPHGCAYNHLYSHTHTARCGTTTCLHTNICSEKSEKAGIKSATRSASANHLTTAPIVRNAKIINLHLVNEFRKIILLICEAITIKY